MDIETFLGYRGSKDIPEVLHPLLRALLIEASGDWDTAHSIAQDDPGTDGSWVHAYLHRKEGDLWNANYWYTRAGRKMPEHGLDEEWEDIARVLVKGQSDE